VQNNHLKGVKREVCVSGQGQATFVAVEVFTVWRENSDTELMNAMLREVTARYGTEMGHWEWAKVWTEWRVSTVPLTFF